MIKNIIHSFTENLNALRDFVDVIKPFLDEHHAKVLKRNSSGLVPFFLASNKLDPKNFPIRDEEKLRKLFEGEVKVELIDVEDNEKAVRIALSKEKSQSFQQAIKAVSRAQAQEELLYKSSLISLVNSAEWFLSQILHEYFDKFPDSIGSKDKQFSLQDLKRFSSINEARASLIDSKIEDIMRGSFEDWIKFLKDFVKLSMGYLDISQNQLSEIYQRRNLIVHNGGHINSIYLSKVSNEFKKDKKIGMDLEVSYKYLNNAINLMELNFILIAADMWKTIDAKDSDRGGTLIGISFEHLVSERWSIGEGLSFFIMNDKNLRESDRITGQLNYWQCKKWQGKYEEIRSEIEKADFSAKDSLFQLAHLALINNNQQFFNLLPQVFKNDKFSFQDLETWPIFREMRQDNNYLKISKKYKPKIKTQPKDDNKPKNSK